jgi:hypothetical protein
MEPMGTSAAWFHVVPSQFRRPFRANLLIKLASSARSVPSLYLDDILLPLFSQHMV